jgi:hypothetical protein
MTPSSTFGPDDMRCELYHFHPENIRRIAEAKGRRPSDLTVIMLDRPRHEDMMAKVRESGARLRLIMDGDVAAGNIGQIRNLAAVPVFADSLATRLIQAADLVSYALYRHNDPGRNRSDYVEKIWDAFDADGDNMHGAVHYTPSFAGGSCHCRPCSGRRGISLQFNQRLRA